MSEAVYTIVKFDKAISKKSLKDIIGEFEVQTSNISQVSLSKQQLTTLISVLFAYGLHYDEIIDKKRPEFLQTIIEDQLPLFKVSRLFSLHLLYSLESSAITELQRLQEKQHNLKDILSNEKVLDFVEAELLDPVTSYRTWEYGRFVGTYLTEHLLKPDQWKKVKKHRARKGEMIEDYLLDLGAHIRTSNKKLTKWEILLLQILIKGKLEPENTTMADYLLVGSIARQKMMHLSAQMETLSRTLEEVLNIQRSRKKGKGGPTL